MSRVNLEDNLIRAPRLIQPQHQVLSYVMVGTFVVPQDGPTYLFLDPGASDRTVFLPEIPPFGGLSFVIVNLSLTNDLNVVDDNGVAVTTLQENQLGFFVSSQTDWGTLTSLSANQNDLLGALVSEPRVVTGNFTVGSSDATIAISRAAPSTTAGTLPTVASRLGRPVRIVDWSTSIVNHVITLTPNGSETIMKQATWTLASNAANLASVTLWPSVALSGWYMVP